MNIKDIARIAGVSASTVSKVINKKDAGINKQTREKVLLIAKENNYAPYSKAIKNSISKFKTIGILLPDISLKSYAKIIIDIESILYKEDYTIEICSVLDCVTNENQAVKNFISRHVESVIFFNEVINTENIKKLSDAGINHFVVDSTFINERNQSNAIMNFDFQSAMDIAIGTVIDYGFDHVALLAKHSDNAAKNVFIKSLNKYNLNYDDSIVFEISDKTSVENALNTLLKTNIKVLIIENTELSRMFYNISFQKKINIASDISIIAFDDQLSANEFIPELTSLQIPSSLVARNLIKTINDVTSIPKNKTIPLVYYPGGSLSKNEKSIPKKITVIGSVNMDITFSVDDLLTNGKTTSILDKNLQPGGKAANQAVGVSKLNGNVSIISLLGNDAYGKELYDGLIKNGVDVSGIIFSNEHSTGSAYIFVSSKAEYAIGDYPGASNFLNEHHIDEKIDILLSSEYCLVQTGIPLDTVNYISKICKKNNIKMILKPAPQKNISNNLLSNIYMIILNEDEINELISGEQSEIDKANLLIKQGVKNVILTQGERGCYYTDGVTSEQFDAIRVIPIDTTGAGDAFISSVATFLAEGSSIIEAIKDANIAAGISVTRVGVQPALPDRVTFDLYSNDPENKNQIFQ